MIFVQFVCWYTDNDVQIETWKWWVFELVAYLDAYGCTFIYLYLKHTEYHFPEYICRPTTCVLRPAGGHAYHVTAGCVRAGQSRTKSTCWNSANPRSISETLPEILQFNECADFELIYDVIIHFSDPFMDENESDLLIAKTFVNSMVL